MIVINRGTIEESIIKVLQKTYPITVDKIGNELRISKDITLRVLKKFQVQGIVQLEPLSDKTYVRLVRHDINFIAKKRQRKFIKHKTSKKKDLQEYDGIMFQ